MSSPKTRNPWVHFAGQLIVPALLLGYATHYTLSVASLSRPETNLLLIGPVYWLLLLCCLGFAAMRLNETIKAAREGASVTDAPAQGIDLTKSLAFIGLTAACIWGIFVFGFVSATVTYTFLLLLVLGVRSLPVLLLTPTVLVGLIWVGMEHYLGLPLPVGLLI